ncbi:MAG TPA: ATP-binding protein [Holophagaceae bacterium]|nr:ATP-binding protein [Holophagaceae bacterium]
MTPSRSLALKVLAVAVTYAVLGQLSVYPSIPGPFNMEAIWLPSGFLFAVLMRSPRRQWALLMGCVVLAGLAVNWYQMRIFGPSFAFALTDPLEVLGGAWAATALLKGRPMDLSRTSDALILGLAGILDGLVAGPIGLLAAHAGSITPPGEFMSLVWGNSVLLSHLFIAPLILAWPTMGGRRSRVLWESVLWMALSAGVTRWGLHHGAPDGVQGLLLFLPFPLLAAAAVRTGPWGASLALAAVSFTALLESSHGHGPLPIQSLTPDLMMVWMQMFLGTETVSIMILACSSEAQRRAEGSLLESESRYRTLVEQFPDAIILRDGSRIRYANPAAVKLFAAPSAAGLEGRSMREFLDRQDASSGELTRSGIHRYTAALRERMLKTLDGREVPVEVTDISISLSQGRPLILDVFRDLTKRREVEDALRRSEQDFQRFFDMAPLPLVLTLGDGGILRTNPLAVELFEVDGVAIESLRTEDFFVHRKDRGRLRQEAAATGRVDGVELDILTHKGRLRRVLASAALVTYGGRGALLTGFMDVTLRMKTEEALRQTQKLESLGLMAGGVAHDFNNLLTALIGNLELARLAQQEEMPAEPFFDAMAVTLRRAGDLSRQMLAYAGQAQVEILPVDINASARELAALMAASMSKKIELRFDLEEDLPLVEGDPVQLQQVLLNLVTNAADAIGGNEGAITLSSRVEERDAEEGLPAARDVVLEVSDTGIGMTEKVRARIFDPFFTTKASGRGLGLSSLLGILKAHQASVRVDSEPGSGSRFVLRFPLPEKLTVPRAGATTGPFSIDGLEGLVLLVDDETDIRMTAGSQLQRMGLRVVEAADGREALREVERHGAALKLVILDLSMPRMDGAEALARIRETHPALPVILSSGFDPNQRTPELLKQPKTWFLPKPYRLSELRRLVGEVLATS